MRTVPVKIHINAGMKLLDETIARSAFIKENFNSDIEKNILDTILMQTAEKTADPKGREQNSHSVAALPDKGELTEALKKLLVLTASHAVVADTFHTVALQVTAQKITKLLEFSTSHDPAFEDIYQNFRAAENICSFAHANTLFPGLLNPNIEGKNLAEAGASLAQSIDKFLKTTAAQPG